MIAPARSFESLSLTKPSRKRGSGSGAGISSNTLQLEGLPPIYSIEAEKALLGAMLSEPDWVIDLTLEQNLHPHDFFHPAHQALFEAFIQMRMQNIPIDPTTLFTHLSDRKLVDVIGGAGMIGELAAGVVSTLTVSAHLKTIRTKSLLRRLQQACAQIVYHAHDRQHEAEIVVDEAESLIFGITDKAVSQSITSARPVTQQALKLVVDIATRREKNIYSGIPSGFDELDRLTTGFKGGEMIVIAARPGVGKTAFALSMVKNFIKERYDEETDRFVKPGYATGLFSLEMTAQQLMLRLLAAHANLSLQKMREGRLTDSELMGLQSVADEVAALPLFIDESSMLSISQLRAKARRMKQLYKIDVIIIDYLQLLTSSSEKARDNRQVEVSEISRGIKALALELNLPIIVLAQLNRKPEEGSSEPALHHLRESGSIEQDADVVMLLSRVEGKDGEAEQIQTPSGYATRARLNIAKQRNGPTDRLDLLFHGAYTRFDSMPRTAR